SHPQPPDESNPVGAAARVVVPVLSWKRVLTSMGLTGVEGRGCRYSGCKMWPVRAVSIFSTLMGRRLAWRRGSEGGTACTKGLVLPAWDEPGPGPELFPESALVQAGSALLPLPPLSRSSRRRRSWRGGHRRPEHLFGAWTQKRIIRGGPRRSRDRARGADPIAGVTGRSRCPPRAAPCAAHSRPGAGAELCDVSHCLSSPGSGEETHFKSSCTEGEIKAFAAFQSNGSPRIDGISLAEVCFACIRLNPARRHPTGKRSRFAYTQTHPPTPPLEVAPHARAAAGPTPKSGQSPPSGLEVSRCSAVPGRPPPPPRGCLGNRRDRVRPQRKLKANFAADEVRTLFHASLQQRVAGGFGSPAHYSTCA
ncbi:hypothetical protein J0S82_016564, partial [Galemys pyrenaicus]